MMARGDGFKNNLKVQIGLTCDLGGRMRLIMDVPFPLASFSILINCARNENSMSKGTKLWENEAYK